MRDIQAAAVDIGLPASISTSFEGSAQVFQQAVANQGMLLFAATSLFYLWLDRALGAAMALVKDRIGDRPEKRAWFVAALCLAWPDGHTETFLGRVEGELVWPPRGEKGFGYDPMFVPLGGTETFGEMDVDAKHAISHRARAFAQVIVSCFG